MIPAAFLCAAMSLPLTSFFPSSKMGAVHLEKMISMADHYGRTRPYDMTILRFLLRFGGANEIPTEQRQRVLIFGGDGDIVKSFRQLAFLAFRAALVPETPWDVIAAANSVPFARESAGTVMCLLEITSEPWEAMRYFAELARPLATHGYFIFYPAFARRFPGFLERAGFFRLPIKWYGAEVWQKQGTRRNHERFKKVREFPLGILQPGGRSASANPAFHQARDYKRVVGSAA